MTKKEKFLKEHNSLASPSMRATEGMLNCFENKKPALFKDGDYSIEKIRRPFIFWLTSLSSAEKIKMRTSKK